MGMRVEVVKGLIPQIVALAQASEDEVCGLLCGVAGSITAYLPCRNVAADPRRAFEIDPAQLIAAHRLARLGGPEIVGHYHSHPAGVATPSPRDAAAAVPDGSLWLIVAGSDARLYRTTERGEGDGRFEAVAIVAAEVTCTGPLAPPESR